MPSLADALKAHSKSRRRANAADRRRRELRDQVWPGSSKWIWDLNDSQTVGFATLPRLLPWVLHLIKILVDGDKGGDPSPAYLELWCRDFGQGIISIADEEKCAYASGYHSTRARRTWRAHMLRLAELGFIKVKPDGNREYGLVLLLDPLRVCARLRKEKKVPDEWWVAFISRANEVGARISDPLLLPGMPGYVEQNGEEII
jgi:hypothetical protein